MKTTKHFTKAIFLILLMPILSIFGQVQFAVSGQANTTSTHDVSMNREKIKKLLPEHQKKMTNTALIKHYKRAINDLAGNLEILAPKVDSYDDNMKVVSVKLSEHNAFKLIEASVKRYGMPDLDEHDIMDSYHWVDGDTSFVVYQSGAEFIAALRFKKNA